MTITALGALTVGAAVPSIPTALVQLSACLAPLLSDQTKLAAAIANPLVLPDITSYIAALNAAITNALAALAALPGLTVTLKADLNVQIGILAALIVAAQAVITLFTGVVSTGDLGYAFDGAVGNVGAELQAAVSGDFPIPTAHANALLLIMTAPAAWTALSVLLRTS